MAPDSPSERRECLCEVIGEPKAHCPRHGWSMYAKNARLKAELEVALRERDEAREERDRWLETAREWKDRCVSAEAEVAELKRRLEEKG